MNIAMTENGPVVEGVPEGDSVLFFAKISEQRGYCVIFGPTTVCLSDSDNIELWDASVAFGLADQEMRVFPVQHGHKYAEGGGMVEFGEKGPMGRDQIFFRLPGDAKSSTYNGRAIKEVYAVL